MFNDEKELLEEFCNYLIKNPPDLITAWNVGFDIPYIVRKIYDNFGNEGLKAISIFNRVSSKITYALQNNYELNDYNVIPGCSIIDMLDLYKKISPVKPDSLALQEIAIKELGEGKLEYNSNDPIELYVDNFELFCKYNIQDVRLIKEIEDKRKIINLAITVTNFSKNNYEDFFTEMSLHDHWLLFTVYQWRQDGKNIVLPSKKPNIKKDITAAYVKEPLFGRHKWLSDIDYSSEYPSNVFSFTISPESKVGKVEDYKKVILRNTYNFYKSNNKEALIKNCIPSYKSGVIIKEELKELENLPVKVNYFELYKNNIDVFNNMGEFEDYCRKHNWVILPTGIIFDQTNQFEAILPFLMDKFLNTRKYYKDLKKKMAKENNIDMEQVYDTYQNAFKIIGNSCFTENHDIITVDGIKCIKDVKIGEKVYSINKKTKKVEIDEIIDTIKIPYHDYIYHFKTRNGGISFSVTRDHNFVLEDNIKNDGLIITKSAESIYNSFINDDRVLYRFPNIYKEKRQLETEYVAKNKNELNIIISNLTSLGYNTRYILKENNNEKYYKIYHYNSDIYLRKNHITREIYKGYVYCVTTKKNHTIFCAKQGNYTFVPIGQCYGVQTNEYFRLYDPDLGESITLTGQSLIKTSINIANKKINEMIKEKEIEKNPNYKHKYTDNVVTSDTDSVIFTLDKLVDVDINNYTEDDLKSIFEISKKVQNEVNSNIKDFCSYLFFKNSNPINIDGIEKKTNIHNAKSEWIALSGVYLAKKMYMNHFVYRDELPCDKYVPMGISLKRSSTPPKMKEFLSNVFIDVLKFKNKNEINEYVKENIKNVKTNYKLKDIALPIGIYNIEKYVKNVPVHVRGANIYNQYFCDSEKDTIVEGKVAYLYVKKWKKNNNLNINKEYVISLPLNSKLWDNLEDYIEVDYNKMIDRLIKKPLEKLYKILNIEFPIINNKQFSFKNLRRN